jgi:hypothetical protein
LKVLHNIAAMATTIGKRMNTASFLALCDMMRT